MTATGAGVPDGRASRLLLRLYPAGWRARYGDEFAALLAERPLGPFDVVDVALGALDARLNLRRLRAPMTRAGSPISLRIGAIAAILSGLGFLGFIAGEMLDRAALGIGGALAGSLSLEVALVALSAFQARRHPVLVWAAFAVPGLGILTTLGGFIAASILPDEPLIGGLSPWAIGTVGVVAMIVGSCLFTTATVLIRALPIIGTAALVVGSLLGLGAVIAAFGFVRVPEPIFGVGFGGFGLGWIVLGLDVLRHGAARPEAVRATARREIVAEGH